MMWLANLDGYGLRRVMRWRLSGVGLLLALLPAFSTQAMGVAPSSEAGRTDEAGPAQKGNRIEITGNTVSGVKCTDGGAVSVNSVNVSGASLKGRTVIIQGNNEDSVKEVDCTDQPGKGRRAPVQINSINIR